MFASDRVRFQLAHLLIGLSLIFVCFLFAKTANADVTIVSQVTVTGLSADQETAAPSFPVTYTSYFQGTKSRIEGSDGTILIFDCDADKVYQLDSRFNTYRTGSIKQLEDFKSVFPTGVASRISFDSDLSFGTSTDTETYVKASASRIPVAGDAHIKVTAGSRGGRRRGGFGFPGGGGGISVGLPFALNYGFGGGGGYGGGSFSRPRYPSYNVLGSIWTSGTYQLPKEKHDISFPFALEMLWDGGPLINDLADKLDQAHEIPLHSELTVTESYENPDDDDDSSNSADENIKTTFDVQTITTAPLDNSLFSVPNGYASDVTPISLPQLAAPRSATNNNSYSQ